MICEHNREGENMMRRITDKSILREKSGFSLAEVLIVALILSVIIGGGYSVMSSGESAWFTTDANIQMHENLRQVIQKVARELQESGSSRDYTDPCNSVMSMRVVISDGAGAGGSDILRFSVPIVCQATGSPIGTSAHACSVAGCSVTISSNPLVTQNCPSSGSITVTEVANWGTSFMWGDTSSIDCVNDDYDRVEYRVDANNQLVRRVLNTGGALLREDVFAQNITDFQAVLSGDQNAVTITVTAQKVSSMGRAMSSSRTINVFLRNRG